MNFVQTCFEERICDCIENLEGIDFDVNHILDFLPEAALGILDATQNISLYQAITSMQTNHPSYLMRSVDVDAIAEKIEMDTNQVAAGLSAIAPILLDDLLKQCESFLQMKK